MTINQPIEDLRRGGTHRERFLALQAELREFSEGAVPSEYEQILHRFLTEFERLRLDSEAQIMKLKKELGFVEGTHKACITVANTLVSVIRRYREDLNRGTPPPSPPEAEKKPSNGDNGVPSDTELLKTICVCGCRDDEDAAECGCSCHKGIPCDQENCVVCVAKKEQLKADSKKALPRKTAKKATKKTAKKAPATKKKKPTKKKATKKGPTRAPW